MEDMHSILEEVCASKANGVLATVIHVEGSAYKKEGASMLFKDDGSQTGLLSAGCLEEDLAARIQRGFGKESETIVYDMRGYDDLTWGEGSGCNGVIHVLAEPVNSSVRKHFHQLKEELEAGRCVVMLKKVNAGTDNTFYLTEDGTAFGNWKKEAMSEEVKGILEKLQESKGRIGFRQVTDAGEEIYGYRYEPKPRLVLFGAGKDAIPLAGIASQAGFSVTVTDWRPALCHPSSFPQAEKLMVAFPDQAIPQLDLKPSDFVVVLTHNFQKDREILSFLKDEELAYLGVLGSARRTMRVLGAKEVPAGITSPIGLSIHAEGPEEIAISIMAELIKVKKERRVVKQACIS